MTHSLRHSFFAVATLLVSAPILPANAACNADLETVIRGLKTLEGAEALGQARVKLLKSTQFWQAWGPKMSGVEFLRAKTVRSLGTSLSFDRPFIVVETLTPITTDLQLAFFTANKRIELLRTLGTNDPGVRKRLESELMSSVELIARNIDEFEAAHAFLLKVSGDTADARMHAAQTVIERLQANRLLNGYFRELGVDAASVVTPTSHDLRALVESFPSADLSRLRRNRNRELYSAIMGIAPTQAVFRWVDSTMGRIPYVNKMRLRRFLRSVEDEKLSYLYAPDIERIASSAASLEERLRMIEVFNAQTDDAFLTTFARRIDMRSLWQSLVARASERADRTLTEKILRAETEAKLLGDLSFDSSSQTSRIVARGIDLAAITGLGYLTYRYAWPSPAEIDEQVIDDAERAATVAAPPAADAP